MLPEFSSLIPKTKKEAVDALASHQGAVPIAGGTDLMVRLRHGEAHPFVVDITAVPELSRIDDADGRIRIGACATHAYVSRHDDITCSAYGLAVACGAVGSPQIRNMGTIGGNLVNASPAADSIPPLLVHDARVTLESAAGVRTETLEAFITAPYKTTIKDGELLTSILVEPLRGYEEGYRRVAKRAALGHIAAGGRLGAPRGRGRVQRRAHLHRELHTHPVPCRRRGGISQRAETGATRDRRGGEGDAGGDQADHRREAFLCLQDAGCEGSAHRGARGCVRCCSSARISTG